MFPNDQDTKYRDITLAFAGIFQAASLVNDLAKTGMADEKAYFASINSINKMSSKTVDDIYGGIENLHLGLRCLIDILDRKNESPDTDISTYVISLIHFERKLAKDTEMSARLKRLLRQAISQAHYFSPTHPQVIESLAAIYLKTLGSYRFRIKVGGKSTYLNKSGAMNKIRALLLAGLRSAVLWQQVGGSRLQLLYARGKMVKIARKILLITPPIS